MNLAFWFEGKVLITFTSLTSSCFIAGHLRTVSDPWEGTHTRKNLLIIKYGGSQQAQTIPIISEWMNIYVHFFITLSLSYFGVGESWLNIVLWTLLLLWRCRRGWCRRYCCNETRSTNFSGKIETTGKPSLFTLSRSNATHQATVFHVWCVHSFCSAVQWNTTNGSIWESVCRCNLLRSTKTYII